MVVWTDEYEMEELGYKVFIKTSYSEDPMDVPEVPDVPEVKPRPTILEW